MCSVKTSSTELMTLGWAEASNITVIQSAEKTTLAGQRQIYERPRVTEPDPRLKNLKMFQLSPSNQTKLGRICNKKWQKIPKVRCTKVVMSFLKNLRTVDPVKAHSTEYKVKLESTYVNVMFPIFSLSQLK